MTYLNVFSFSPDFTENKLVPIIISADGPYPDTTYSGVARLSIIEEYPNYSAGFVNPSTGDFDTVLDIDIFGDGEVFHLVSDYENEFIIIIAEDTLNELKTSIPLGIVSLIKKLLITSFSRLSNCAISPGKYSA